MDRWTPAEIEQLRELASRRISSRDAAQIVGRSWRATCGFAAAKGIRFRSRGALEGYSQAERETIKRLSAGGHSAKNIAREIGRGARGVSSWCARHGIKLTGAKKPDWTGEEIQLMRDMIDRGERHSKIAAALGRSVSAVHHQIKLGGYRLWSDERVGRLQALTGEGLSASEIAERLGVTKNAVIGKCGRRHLRLPLAKGERVSLTTEERRERRRAYKQKLRARYIENGLNSKGKPRQPLGPRQRIARNTLKATRIYIKPDDPGIRPDAPRGAPAAIGELARLKCVCHWPHGDPSAEDFTFCYAPRSPVARPPYCDFHLERSSARMQTLAQDSA